MIEISNKGSNVTVNVKGRYPVMDWTWNFSIDVTHEAYAKMLGENLRESMSFRLCAIREEAYRQGWKDAKAKTKKQGWFRRTW